MPVRIVTVSTATGTFGPVDLGDAYRYAGYASGAASTDHTYEGTVEGSLGGSGQWTTVLTLTTGNSTGHVSSTGTDLVVFDKLRVNLSANNSTASTPVWVAGTH